MSGDCEMCGDHCLDCKCNGMKIKKIRFCDGCGKQHDTGVDNRETGEFKPIETCIDCLMSKCKFEPITTQIHL